MHLRIWLLIEILLVAVALYVGWVTAWKTGASVEQERQLCLVESQSSAIEPLRSQTLRDLKQQQQIAIITLAKPDQRTHLVQVENAFVDVTDGGRLADRRQLLRLELLFRSLDEALRMIVAQLGDRSDDRATEPLVDDVTVLRHAPHDGEGESIDVGVERAQLFAEEARQHGNDLQVLRRQLRRNSQFIILFSDLLNEVDTRGTTARLCVQRVSSVNKIAHVCNVNPDFKLTCIKELDSWLLLKYKWRDLNGYIQGPVVNLRPGFEILILF